MENGTPGNDDLQRASGAVQSLEKKKRKSFALFLIESEIKPFVFVGRCMQYFGIGAVVGFFVGAAALYLYALFYPLPGTTRVVATTPEQSRPVVTRPTEDQPTIIRLHGLVTNESGQPTKEAFVVGVLASQHGPWQNSNGSFTIDVAPRPSYDIALWNMGAERVKVYSGYPADKDGDQYVLPDLQFTPSIRSSKRSTTSDDPLVVWQLKSDKRRKQLNSE